LLIGMTSPFNNVKKKDILIVDDDTYNIFALKQLIQSISPFMCLSAYNGREAIKRVLERNETEGCQFALIIMDLNMPVMDG